MSLPKKHVIRIGLDFDGVVAYNPVRIIRAPVAFLKQRVLGIKKLRFYIPKSPFMRFMYILAHETSFFPAIGTSKLRDLSKRPDIELYLITARFHFLKPSLYRWLDRWKLRSVFKGIYVNTADRQPHEHKLATIRALHLDYFVEDNWDIVTFLDGKTKTTIYWVYNINDQRMSILFTLTYYDPYVSGLTICVKRLAEEFAKQNHTVSVLCMRHTRTIPLTETIHNVSVIRARPTLQFYKGFLSFDWVRQAYLLTKTSDVIVVNLPQVEGWIAAILAKCFGKRVIAIYHCELVLPKGIMNRCIQFGVTLANSIACFFSDTIITYTDDYARYSRVLRPFRKKIQSIYPPIPIPRVSPSTKKKLTTVIGSHKLVIGIAARLAAEKGIEYVIEALQYLTKDTMIAVAGPMEPVGEEAYKKKILTLVSSNAHQILFLGTLTQDEMGAFYALIDVLVVSSVNSTEAFGLVQVEAMLCGVPVVATDLPGVRVPIQQTHMGIVVPPKNAKDIAEAIIAIVKKKKSYILPTTSIQTIFSYEQTIDAYNRCFKS